MKHLRKFAQAGRNGDNTVGHLTTGEIVIPKSAQTPEVRALIAALLGQTGHDLGRYTVGGSDDSRNPKTGAREFWDTDPMGSGADYGGDNTGQRSEMGYDNSGGQIADLSPQDQAKLGFNPADLSDTRQVDISAGPNEARFGSAARDTFGHRGLGALVGWGADKVGRMVDNPAATLVDFAVSGVPVLGQINTLAGVAGFPTAGSTATALARNGTAYGSAFGGAPTAEIANAISTEDSDKTSPTGDKPGDKDTNSTNADSYNPLSSGPSGSGLSPLAQALAGMGIRNDGWNNWGRRKTFGPLVSSYDPNGRQYVTPWDYRG